MPPSTSALSASTTTPRASSPAPSGSSDSDDDDLSFFYEKDENGLLVRHTKTPVTKTQTRTSTRNSGSGSGSGGEKRGYVPPASTHTRRSAELQAAEAAPVSRPMTRARSGSATVVQGATTGSRPMTRVKTAGPSSFKNDAQRYSNTNGTAFGGPSNGTGEKENRHPAESSIITSASTSSMATSGRGTPTISTSLSASSAAYPVQEEDDSDPEIEPYAAYAARSQAARAPSPPSPVSATSTVPPTRPGSRLAASAATRTPSATATYGNTRTPATKTGVKAGGSVVRTAGPQRVTMAEKARQDQELAAAARAARANEEAALVERQRTERNERLAQLREERARAEREERERQLERERAAERERDLEREFERERIREERAQAEREAREREELERHELELEREREEYGDDDAYERERQLELERERERDLMEQRAQWEAERAARNPQRETNPYGAVGGSGGLPDDPRYPPQPRRRESETAVVPAAPVPVVAAKHSPSARNVRPAVGSVAGRGTTPGPPQARSQNHRSSPTAQDVRRAEREREERERAPSRAEVTAPTPGALVSGAVFTINRRSYTRIDLIGKGGSSRVYRVLAQPKANESAVSSELLALKRVVLDQADEPTVQGYMNEINLLRRLEGNKRVIRLIDSEVQVTNGRRHLYMVMECGEIDLNKLMLERSTEPLEMDWVKYYWRQMLQAVQVIHDEKIVHSDLKPANFVLVKGFLKLIDFGIANAIANDTTNIQRDHQIGTVNFMSPEALEEVPEVRRFKVGRPSDVWSLGCILYQMIYRQTPFAKYSVYYKMRYIPDPDHKIDFPDESVPIVKASAQPNQEPENLTHLARPVPRHAIETVQQCLIRNPKERATIPDLLEDPWLTADYVAQAPAPAAQRPASPPIPNPRTDERMAFIDLHYMNQVLSHVVNNYGAKMTEKQVEDVASSLISELRRVYDLETSDGQSNRE